MPREDDVHSSRRSRLPGPLGAVLLAGFVFALLVSGPPPARGQDVVALVHPSNATSSMSLKQLRLLYGTYKRTWSGGVPVHLILPPENDPAMKYLVSQVFRKQSEADVSKYYVQAIFQQKISGAPPQLSLREALLAVRNEPGAIVLVDRDSVRDTTGLRMLPIED